MGPRPAGELAPRPRPWSPGPEICGRSESSARNFTPAVRPLTKALFFALVRRSFLSRCVERRAFMEAAFSL
eukprot:5058025-Pyramimonas_sp.AAC.1